MSEKEQIILKRCQGALADAAIVPTDDVERGIRLLTARIAELEREVREVRGLHTYRKHAEQAEQRVRVEFMPTAMLRKRRPRKGAR